MVRIVDAILCHLTKCSSSIHMFVIWNVFLEFLKTKQLIVSIIRVNIRKNLLHSCINYSNYMTPWFFHNNVATIFFNLNTNWFFSKKLYFFKIKIP